MLKFVLKKLPECVDWKGVKYPARYGVTLIDNLGLRWDGGEFETREEAISAADKFIG